VVSHNPYFNEKSQVRYVFIEGELFKVETPKPDKAEAEKKP
jgi:hypothetical protein